MLGEGDVLALTVPAIDLDLLGLMLKTTPITVDVSSREGDGLLLGNVLTSALSTLDATPAELSELSGHVNNVLDLRGRRAQQRLADARRRARWTRCRTCSGS